MSDEAHRQLLPSLDPTMPMQAAVLGTLLTERPAQLTLLDLYRERRDPEDPGKRDALDRAVQCLASEGLVDRSGPLVMPSRAALKSEALSRL